MSEELKAKVEELDKTCRAWGKYASDMSCENIILRKRVMELEAAIISGGAIVPDAKPLSLTDSTDWQAIGDYAEAKEEVSRLKAEVERLRIAGGESEPRFVLLSDYRHLKAENERLRKAGDDVLHEWSMGDEKGAKNYLKALVIWTAAKEGKPNV